MNGLFTVPYHNPPWNPGIQIVNLGMGGPSSHMGLRATQPQVHPTVYRVAAYGMGGAMPRQVIGPTQPITSNNYSNPLVHNNLLITGIMKNPRGG